MDQEKKNRKKIPERTCIICRNKAEKKDMFRIYDKDGIQYGFDEKMRIQKRGKYICKTHRCLKKLSESKKYKMDTADLLKMLKLIDKEKKDYINILKAMKSSNYLAFGINMVLEDIAQIHFMVIAEDINANAEKKLLEKIKEYNIKYVYYSNKKELGTIFDKDEINVIAVKNKKIVRGIMEK